MIHWSDELVRWCRSVVPELESRPVYLRHYAELPESMRDESALAYTETMGDLKARETLQERGDWQGRGIFIALSDCVLMRPKSEQRAILLHELSHIADTWHSRLRRDESSFSDIERTLLKPNGATDLLRQFHLEPLSEATETRLSHGPGFVRAAIHLWSRSWTETNVANITGPRYGLSDEQLSKAVRTLLPELRSGGHIIRILDTQSPPDFLRLFDEKHVENTGEKAANGAQNE